MVIPDRVSYSDLYQTIEELGFLSKSSRIIKTMKIIKKENTVANIHIKLDEIARSRR